MKGTRSIAVIAAVFAAAMVFAHAAGEQAKQSENDASAARGYTVGDFAVNLAQSLRLTPPGGTSSFTAESASWALWQNGIRIQADSKKSLTEEVLTSTMSQIGINLVPTEPGRLVTAEKAGTAISTFVNSDTLERLRAQGATLAGNGDDDFNNGNGKGGKFKRKSDKSPSSGSD